MDKYIILQITSPNRASGNKATFRASEEPVPRPKYQETPRPQQVAAKQSNTKATSGGEGTRGAARERAAMHSAAQVESTRGT